MSKATRATKALDAAGVSYVLHPYDYRADADAKGLQAAQALGLQPHTVLKTLMAWVDDKPVCVVIPCDRRVSLKKLASAYGGKSARMMEVADAERRTCTRRTRVRTVRVIPSPRCRTYWAVCASLAQKNRLTHASKSIIGLDFGIHPMSRHTARIR